MSLWREQALHIPADHPSAAGHFPGRPIIPGALLLDAVLAAIGAPCPFTLSNVKFLRSVPHGAALLIRWQGGNGAPYRFECSAASGLVLSGALAPGGAA